MFNTCVISVGPKDANPNSEVQMIMVVMDIYK